MRTQVLTGTITVELQKRLAKVIPTGEDTMSALRVTPSGVSSRNPRSTQALPKSDSPERSGQSTLGMEKPSLLR
jgi:hypothetical protein